MVGEDTNQGCSVYFLTNPLRVPSILCVFVRDCFFHMKTPSAQSLHKQSFYDAYLF